MSLAEFMWIFHKCLLEAGLLFDDEKFPHMVSIRMASKDEDSYYDGGEEKYILRIKVAKTAVFDGVRLPVLIALKAVVAEVQRRMGLTILEVAEADGDADILFKPPASYYGIETGVVEAGE